MTRIIDNILKKYQHYSFFNELNIFIKPLEYYLSSKGGKYSHYFVKFISNTKNDKLMNSLYPSYNSNTNVFIEIYSKVIKTYNAFRKLINLYRISKFETIIEKDLLLNTINIKDKNVICIIQNNKKYLFYIFELSKIIYNSLSNSTYFFSEPLQIKNPYNNSIFEYHNLCNIFFFMKFKCIKYNELFDKFFKCNFNPEIFLHNNFNLLRHFSIKNYTSHGDLRFLYIEIMNMIDNYNKRINIKYRILIHEDFPMDLLYNIMKKYLYLYIYSWYSYVEYENTSFGKELNHRLYYFQKYNPKFGRIYYKFSRNFCPTQKRNIITLKKTFNDNHINFSSDLDMRFDGHYKYFELYKRYVIDKLILNVNDIHQEQPQEYEYDDDDDDDHDVGSVS